jgi:integrase
MSKLTALHVKNLKFTDLGGVKRPVRIGDGGGLYLQITKGGSKSWLFRYQLRGKSREMGLGSYGVDDAGVTLSDARRSAKRASLQLAEGLDPIEERSLAAAQQRVTQQEQLGNAQRTFRVVAEEFITAEAQGWKNLRTERLWRASLESHVYQKLGNVPVANIDRAMVKEAVQTVWISAPSIGRKVLRRIASVLRYAAAHQWRSNDNPADGKMLRLTGLPLQQGERKQPALSWRRVPDFYSELTKINGMSALALRFLVLSALRSSEVRLSRWSWLTFDSIPLLTIPGEFMKSRKSDRVTSHRLPLAEEPLRVIAAAYNFVMYTRIDVADLRNSAGQMGDAFIFPSPLKKADLSDMSLSAVIRRMNSTDGDGTVPQWCDPDGRAAVPHGFRGTFRTWVDDTLPDEDVAAETALAHRIGNSVTSRYRRSDLLNRRISLMAKWSEHCVSASAVAKETA